MNEHQQTSKRFICFSLLTFTLFNKVQFMKQWDRFGFCLESERIFLTRGDTQLICRIVNLCSRFPFVWFFDIPQFNRGPKCHGIENEQSKLVLYILLIQIVCPAQHDDIILREKDVKISVCMNQGFILKYLRFMTFVNTLQTRLRDENTRKITFINTVQKILKTKLK